MNLKNKRNIYFSYYFVKFKHGREDNHVNSTRYHSKEYKILSNYVWFQNRVFVKKDNEGALLLKNKLSTFLGRQRFWKRK